MLVSILLYHKEDEPGKDCYTNLTTGEDSCNPLTFLGKLVLISTETNLRNMPCIFLMGSLLLHCKVTR